MPAYLPPRDLGSDVDNVKATFSSWDACMSKAYCKWPVIVGIIIGSLIVLSVVWCLARCLCCGMECCCSCFSCCNSCCPSRREHRDGYQTPAYQQPPPQQQPWQYQSPQPPMYGAGGAYGYRGPQTATFDTTRKNQRGRDGGLGYNEDALPVMPSWDNAPSRHVEDNDDEANDDGVELEKMSPPPAQHLPNNHRSGGYSSVPVAGPDANGRFYSAHGESGGSDLGTMRYTQDPYGREHNQHQQYVASPVSSVAPSTSYPPTYHTRPPPSSTTSTVYEPYSTEGGYAGSVAPSYHTVAPHAAPQQYQKPIGGIGRKPVSGSYRNV